MLFVNGMCVVVTYVTMSVWYTNLLPGKAGVSSAVHPPAAAAAMSAR